MEREDCLQLFFASGLTDFNLQSSVGLTVLHLVVQYKLINTLRIMKQIPGIDWNLTTINGDSALSKALKNNDLEAVKIILSVPRIENEIDSDQLRSQNVPRDMIIECLKMAMENHEKHQQVVNRSNDNLKSLMAMLGGGGGTMECPVCLIPFTAQRRVFMCRNGHFTCGDCKDRIQVCSLTEALNTKIDWLHLG